MQKLKDELSKIYTSKVFQDFLIRNNRLVQYHSESYKEYFGFNINRGKAENIKFYITYLRHLSEKELVQLLGFNPPINLKKAFQERSNNYDPKKGGTGTTFTFKYDVGANRFTIGVYFLINNSKGWNIDDYPFLVNYKEQTGEGVELSSEYLLYYEFDTNHEMLNTRIHCYSKSKKLFSFLEKKYDQVIQPFTHELEIYFDRKSMNKSKVNLLMDLVMFRGPYQETRSGIEISNFIKRNSFLNKFLPVCPGFYSDSSILSIYFMNLTAEIDSPIHTFENLFNVLNYEYQ